MAFYLSLMDLSDASYLVFLTLTNMNPLLSLSFRIPTFSLAHISYPIHLLVLLLLQQLFPIPESYPDSLPYLQPLSYDLLYNNPVSSNFCFIFSIFSMGIFTSTSIIFLMPPMIPFSVLRRFPEIHPLPRHRPYLLLRLHFRSCLHGRFLPVLPLLLP